MRSGPRWNGALGGEQRSMGHGMRFQGRARLRRLAMIAKCCAKDEAGWRGGELITDAEAECASQWPASKAHVLEGRGQDGGQVSVVRRVDRPARAACRRGFKQGRNPAARVYESIGPDCFLALPPGWLNLGLWEGPGAEDEAQGARRRLVRTLALDLPAGSVILDVGNGLGTQEPLIAETGSPGGGRTLHKGLPQTSGCCAGAGL
jgi:hypothetical protein